RLPLVRHGWVSRDVYLLDLDDPKGEWKPLSVGAKANYFPFYFDGRIYVLTDEGAPRRRVLAVDPARLERKDWSEVVAEDPQRVLDEADAAGGKLVLGYFDDVKSRIELRDPAGKLERVVELPGVGAAHLVGRPDDDE